MALGDPYASPEELEFRLGFSDDGTFDRLLNAASRAVELFTRRQFNRDDDEYPSTRRFRALDPERLPVDDFYSLDGLEVEVDGVFWDTTLNVDVRSPDGVVGGQIGWPYSDLFAVNRSWPILRRPTIAVTAHWGWAEIPAGITEATLDAAEAMAAVVSTGQVRSETIGGYSVSYGRPILEQSGEVPPALIKALPFRRKRFGIA